jgi:hypothetical protein
MLGNTTSYHVFGVELNIGNFKDKFHEIIKEKVSIDTNMVTKDIII